MTNNDKQPSLWYWSPIGIFAFIMIAPYYAIRMLMTHKYRAGIRERLTLYTRDEKKHLREGTTIWFHTVSVGELQAAKPLIAKVKKQYPHLKILVSTVTETGQKLAKESNEVDESIYLPLDVYALCRRVVKWINPVCVIVMETELWPNFIRAISNQSIPLVLINGRLSDTSFKRYLQARFLFSPLLHRFTHILTQSEQDTKRFNDIGTPADRLQTTGNIKFDISLPTDETDERLKWRNRFGLKDDEILLLGGSTFPGEEALLARLIQTLQSSGIPIRLAVAPRHIHRSFEVENDLEDYSAPVVRRTTLNDTNNRLPPGSVILIDTIGELHTIYAAADIVFIGKSMLERGGQNPIEPAVWRKPLLFGPNMQNFRDISAKLIEAGGAISVQNESELQDACQHLALNATKRQQMGESGRSLVEKNQGSLQRILQKLDAYLHLPQKEHSA